MRISPSGGRVPRHEQLLTFRCRVTIQSEQEKQLAKGGQEDGQIKASKLAAESGEDKEVWPD